MKLSDLAENLGCELIGNGNIEIRGVAGIDHAGPEHVTFLANPKYTPLVKKTRAGALLVRKPIEQIRTACLISKDPYLDFARSITFFYQPPKPKAEIHATASIAASARIGEGASIGAYAVVGENVVIGRNATIHPHVVIYEGVQIGDHFVAHAQASIREFCRIGNRVTLGNGVVIGGDGFGFVPMANAHYYKIPQSGITVIEDDVEIQSLSSIDRASVGETVVRSGVKIDSLVQVGHSCVVGEDSVICAQSGLAGSTVIGKKVRIAGQVGVAGHLTIHDNATVYGQAGVTNDIETGAVVSGFPAVDSREWARMTAAMLKLPSVLKQIRELKQLVQKAEDAKSSKK